MTLLATVAQTPAPGEKITLFRLDATSVGGTVMFFCQAATNVTGVTFGGQFYTPVDVDFSGFETNSSGALPQPKMKLANSNKVFQNIVNTYGDLVGCPISRIRTFSRFLDGQPEADPTAFYGPDAFQIERKSSENPVYIEWELSASIDQEGKMLPGRVVVRDTCLWRYRQWNAVTGAFDYSKVQCPYTGAASFDEGGNPVTDNSKDQCGRRLSDCKLRFGVAPLPFGGFPGVGRYRG